MTTTQPDLPAPGRDYRTTLLRVLKGAQVVIRHAAAAIGWFSHVWFNFMLPVSILLAGICIMAGLVLLALVMLAPEGLGSVREFTHWFWQPEVR